MDTRPLQGRYQLHEVLGSGGMGTVYRATDRLTSQIVALKQVSAPTEMLVLETSSTSATMARKLALAQEFQLLATLRHPHIISVLDYGFDEVVPYFTMNYLAGAQPVSEAVREVSGDQQIEMLIQMLQALSYLHRRGILHRDLKPANVLVADGTLKVLDFGLATPRGHTRGLSGTISYMAPEILRELPASEASDLYSVGIIAYEIFAGQHPFSGQSTTALITEILTKTPDPALLHAPEKLSDWVSRLLQKKPEDRFSSADEAIDALNRAAGRASQPESIAIRESFLQAAQLVGRDAELHQLSEALREVDQAKSGRLYLIGGESGVGKSRLIDELRIRALVEGVLVLRGQAVVEGSGVSYDLWRDPVRRLVLDAPLTPLEAGVLKPLVPDIGSLIQADVPDAPALEASAMQQRLSRQIVELFRRKDRPILLILEDLHWAGEALAVMDGLLSALPELGVMIVASYRVDEAPELPQQFPDATVLNLSRLQLDDIARLSHSMLGQKADDAELIDFLQRETEGNAFFLVEVVRALAEEAGSLSEVGHTTLPAHVFAGGIHAVIMRRLSHIPDWGTSLLEAAAVAGRALDLDVLQRLAEARKVNLEDWITACANVAVIDRADGRWRFAHDKLREAAASTLVGETLQDRHREVAQAIEAVYPNDERYAAKLAEHYRESGDAAAERKFALIAGDVAMRISAFRHALQHYERALALLPDPAAEERINLRLRLAEAYHFLDEFDTAKQHLHQVLELTGSNGAEVAQANALFRLCQIAVAQGDYQTAYRYSSQALPLARKAGDARTLARVLYAIGDPRPRQLAMTEVISSLEESLKLASEAGDVVQELHTLNRLGAVLQTEQQFALSQQYLEKCRDLALKVGNRERAIAALINIGAAAWYQEQFEMAYTSYQQALSVARETGNRIMLVDSLSNLGLAACMLHKTDEAQAVLHEGLRTARQINSRYGMLTNLMGLAALCLQQGKVDQGLAWMGLVWHHPSGTESLHQDIELMRPHLLPAADRAEFEAGMDAGRSLALDQVASEVLEAP